MRDKLILGIHHGHNASVAVVQDGELVYAIQEERLAYKKNFTGWPIRAIGQALRHMGINGDEVPHVAISSLSSPVIVEQTLEGLIYTHKNRLTWLGHLRGIATGYAYDWLGQRLFLNQKVKAVRLAGMTRAQIHHVDHHRCHAAASYFGLRQNSEEPYLILTLDGAGDKECATVSLAKQGKFKEIARTSWRNSLGTIYSWVTYLMGFVPLEHEYKLMGMAPYASPESAVHFSKMFKNYLDLDEKSLSFFRKIKKVPFSTNQLGRRLQRELTGLRFDHLCAGMQHFTEAMMVRWVELCVRRTGVGKVLCGGGVFMNVKANKKIMELPEVEYLGVFPSCGDESNAIGAAYQVYAERYKSEEIRPLGSFYLGDSFSDAEAEVEIKSQGFPYTHEADIEKKTAQLLAQGVAVARVKGRMEFGARALCNRSILGDPADQDLVRFLNLAVKKRDFWMPFAPVVKEDKQQCFIQNPKSLPSPFMMLTFDTRENFREMIAAVHNADLTARAQILRRGDNPEMEKILDEFEQLTGRGVLLNTSYNLHGEPIVAGPKEALRVFGNSGLTHLALGNFMVTKNNG